MIRRIFLAAVALLAALAANAQSLTSAQIADLTPLQRAAVLIRL